MNNKLSITFLMSTDGILVVLFRNGSHIKTTIAGKKALLFTADFLHTITDISLKELLNYGGCVEINDIRPTRIVVNEVVHVLESDEKLEFGKSLIEKFGIDDPNSAINPLYDFVADNLEKAYRMEQG